MGQVERQGKASQAEDIRSHTEQGSLWVQEQPEGTAKLYWAQGVSWRSPGLTRGLETTKWPLKAYLVLESSLMDQRTARGTRE